LSASPQTDLFLRIKKVLRLHPDWTDDQIAEYEGVRVLDRGLIATARKDLEAG
jgi:hypothetical protein